MGNVRLLKIAVLVLSVAMLPPNFIMKTASMQFP